MSEQIKIAGIINESIVDGPGIRMTIFAQGCKHHCKGCHNPHTHSFDAGETIEIDKVVEKIKKNPLLDGVTFSGGDPFEQADSFAVLAQKVRKLGMNVVTYTGYTYEQLMEHASKKPDFMKLMENTDILVDGPFILEQKDLLLKFRGSRNQRLIDVASSLRKGKIVLANVEQDLRIVI